MSNYCIARSMVRQQHGVGQYHACKECRGLWIPRTYLLALKHRAAQQLKHLKVEPLAVIAHAVPLTCPECTSALVPRVHESVPIDICSQCRAVWLDGDEILQIAKVNSAQADRTKARQDRARNSSGAASSGAGSWGTEEVTAPLSVLEAIGWTLFSIFD